MIKIELTKYLDFKNEVESKGLKLFNYSKQGRVFLIAIDGPLYYTHSLAPKNAKDYEGSIGLTANAKIGDEVVVAPFASKGRNHFKGTGVELLVPAGEEIDIDLEVPNGTYRYNAVEVLNGDYGDQVQLQVIDTPAGSYSGYANAVLDQFGINWKMSKELIKELPYEATLYSGMILRVKYFNKQQADKTVYVNHSLHLVL